MYITKARKYHKQADGSFTAYDYFRLTRKRYDASGREKTEHFCLGQLVGLTKAERNELADMLTVMIERGERPLSFSASLNELAMEFYLKYRESRPAAEFDPVLRAEAERDSIPPRMRSGSPPTISTTSPCCPPAMPSSRLTATRWCAMRTADTRRFACRWARSR
jgi:hypothetical protein